LSILEHGAYRKLLDHLYSTEKPLPLDENRITRLVGCKSVPERAVVLRILKEFFIKTPRGWTHKRFIRELKHVNLIRYRNRENGKKGGRPPKDKKPSGNPVETDWVILGNPNETQNNQTLDSKTLDSKILDTRLSQDAAVVEVVKANGNGHAAPPSPALVRAFLALGHQPFGSQHFQNIWLEQYNQAGNDPNWTDIMEMTIQICQNAHVKVPGLFYKHKHEIENGEVKMRYKVMPQ